MSKKKDQWVSFKYLPKERREQIIKEHIQFIIDTVNFENLHKNTNLWKAYSYCKKNNNLENLGDYIRKYCENKIISECSFSYYNVEQIEPMQIKGLVRKRKKTTVRELTDDLKKYKGSHKIIIRTQEEGQSFLIDDITVSSSDEKVTIWIKKS